MEEEIIEIREIINEVNERYKDSLQLASMKTGEIFPSETAPVLIPGETGTQAALMKWGIPKWQGPGVIINARAETVIEKQTFRSLLAHYRCVIPTTGFFEWQKQDSKTKTKYLFRMPDSKMLYLAGFYGTYAGMSAYVILTTAANPSILTYHDRMPLILRPDQIDNWLKKTDFALEYVQSPCGVVLSPSAA
jgi:putative SOS response-associated peptidase YedK